MFGGFHRQCPKELFSCDVQVTAVLVVHPQVDERVVRFRVDFQRQLQRGQRFVLAALPTNASNASNAANTVDTVNVSDVSTGFHIAQRCTPQTAGVSIRFNRNHVSLTRGCHSARLAVAYHRSMQT